MNTSTILVRSEPTIPIANSNDSLFVLYSLFLLIGIALARLDGKRSNKSQTIETPEQKLVKAFSEYISLNKIEGG
jgi:hypothetical protein